MPSALERLASIVYVRAVGGGDDDQSSNGQCIWALQYLLYATELLCLRESRRAVWAGRGGPLEDGVKSEGFCKREQEGKVECASTVAEAED